MNIFSKFTQYLVNKYDGDLEFTKKVTALKVDEETDEEVLMAYATVTQEIEVRQASLPQ